jgi:hypothetical protein
MLASELIKRLSKRLDLYGDVDVVFRDSDGDFIDPGTDIGSVYYDDEDERIVISDQYDFFEE